MTLAASAFVPPNSAMASSLPMSGFLPISAVNHTLQTSASVSYNEGREDDTVAPMDERALTLQGRIAMACEHAGHNINDPAPERQAEARKFLQAAAGWTSRMAVSDWFSPEPPKVLTTKALLGISDSCRVDMRWLATGDGDMLPRQLPTDVLDVAKLLDKIQDSALRRAAVALARVVAVDPLAQVTRQAEAQRWSAAIQRIADGLETMEDGELKKLAVAWATTAAFNPERLPRETSPAGTPARRATDKRPARS